MIEANSKTYAGQARTTRDPNSMTTVQIIGIAVAALAVLLLIVALIVTRRRGEAPEDEPRRAGGSFLDEAPQDTFSVLGKAEQPVEDITIDPAMERAAAAQRAAAARRRAARSGSRSALLSPEASAWTGARTSACARATCATSGRSPRTTIEDDTEITGELRPDETVALPPEDAPPAPEGESGDQVAATQPARPAEGGHAAGDVAAQESGSGGRLVPLSDIIVTTSSKMVDLDDPEVRRMLTELVTFEIDQAADFRRKGQTHRRRAAAHRGREGLAGARHERVGAADPGDDGRDPRRRLSAPSSSDLKGRTNRRSP